MWVWETFFLVWFSYWNMTAVHDCRFVILASCNNQVKGSAGCWPLLGKTPRLLWYLLQSYILGSMVLQVSQFSCINKVTKNFHDLLTTVHPECYALCCVINVGALYFVYFILSVVCCIYPSLYHNVSCIHVPLFMYISPSLSRSLSLSLSLSRQREREGTMVDEHCSAQWLSNFIHVCMFYTVCIYILDLVLYPR